MPLSQEDRAAIIDAAANKTKKEFASEVSSRTSLTSAEVAALAKSEEEKAALASVIGVVTKATGNNKAKADAIRGITGGVEALVKIASMLV
jgi:hypothetical protein